MLACSVKVTLGDKEVEISCEVSSEVIMGVLGCSDWLMVEVKLVSNWTSVI